MSIDQTSLETSSTTTTSTAASSISTTSIPTEASLGEDIGPPTDRLVMAPGRWITNWRPEDPAFWHGPGRPTARTNLVWSVFC